MAYIAEADHAFFYLATQQFYYVTATLFVEWRDRHAYNPAVVQGNRHYWWEKEASGGETTITLTPSASDTYGFAVYEVSGLTDADSWDVGVIGSGNIAGGTITTGSTASAPSNNTDRSARRHTVRA